MKNLVKILPIVAALALVSCKKDQAADQLVANSETTSEVTSSTPTQPAAENTQEVHQGHDQASEVKPVGPLTSLALSESTFAFGKIKKGSKVDHVYEVTNTGKNPLVISQVKPGCGCTAPDYTRTPILPGQKGKITLSFDSSNFDGLVSKQAEVFANVEKAPIIIGFSADIQP